MASDIRRPPESEWVGTLLGELATDGMLDDLRQLFTDLGARPYRAFMVRTRWSGESRGEGVETVIQDTEIVPTPKVDPISSVNRVLLDIGMDEAGSLRVSEISPKYTEHQLMGFDPMGGQIPGNETFSWEIILMRGDRENPHRRRFMVSGIPAYDPEALQWTVQLVRAGKDREQGGVPG